MPLRAIYCWQRILNLKPNDLEAQSRLGKLYRQIGNDDAARVKQLLKGGANPNVRNKLNTTPLLEAAFHSNGETIKALLDAGADPNAAGVDGQTPLMLIDGDDDLRTPPADGGEIMFRALKYLKVPTVMVRFPGETHELSRSGKPRHRVERLQHRRE